MNKQRNTILLLLAIIISCCVVILLAGALIWNTLNDRTAPQPAAATPIFQSEPTSRPDNDPTSNPESESTSTSENEPTSRPEETSEPKETLPDDILAAMDDIEAQVIDLRGLAPSDGFSIEILSQEELTERVSNEFFADYTPEEANDDSAELSLLGLVEPDFDLLGLLKELYSDSIAGYYDDEKGEMVLIGSDDFKGPEKLTYAHEYAHALQDENFDFDEGLGYNDDACEEDSERCAAIQALIEGEASLIELQWFFDYASREEQQEVVSFYADLDSSSFDTYPAYLQQDFTFPYNQGFTFAETLFNDGGWAALDAAYANLPVSTEQILHPEKYPGDTPIPVDLPDLETILGNGWEVLEDNVMGEWFTYLILAHGWQTNFRIDDAQAAEAAAGWGGDHYVVLVNRELNEIIFALKSTWDTGQDKNEFAVAFQDYGNARFGAGSSFEGGGQLWEADTGVHTFVETDGGTIWIAAPNPNLAQLVYEAIK